MTEGNRSMEVDSTDEGNGRAPSSEEKRLVAMPVAGGSYGVGLPYAPEDWPCPGDVWRWKVGNRKTTSGHWVDRYLYPPARFHKATGSKSAFQSRSTVEEFVRKEFPEKDVNEFFSSFIWRVPCADHTPKKGLEGNTYIYASPIGLDVNGHSEFGSAIVAGGCKAGNKMCGLQENTEGYALTAKACDICCSEAGFCRDCCCILCCKTVDFEYGGYSFIRCEATVDENYICGHVAHLECALRSYMAGTVGGSIGLDVEYYCRRCDNKTDLITHVTKLLRICESLDSRDDIEKILNLGFCILRGSEQMRAKSLKNHFGLVMAKLKGGVPLDQIWKLEDDISTLTTGDMPHDGNEIIMLGALDITRDGRNVGSANQVEPFQQYETTDRRPERPVYITSDHYNVSAKLEDEIDQVLQELKNSQELEYKIAEQKLYAQKDFLLSLYHQLDSERSELANPMPSANGGDCDVLLANVLNRVDQIKHEEEKLRNMMKIAKGFGRTPKSILREYIDLAPED